MLYVCRTFNRQPEVQALAQGLTSIHCSTALRGKGAEQHELKWMLFGFCGGGVSQNTVITSQINSTTVDNRSPAILHQTCICTSDDDHKTHLCDEILRTVTAVHTRSGGGSKLLMASKRPLRCRCLREFAIIHPLPTSAPRARRRLQMSPCKANARHANPAARAQDKCACMQCT